VAPKFAGVGFDPDSVAHVGESKWDSARADPDFWDAGTAVGGWPTFRFVHDLRTGSILEVSALAAAATDPTVDEGDADAGIEQISAWMYLRPEDAARDSSSQSKLAMAGGGTGSSVFAKESHQASHAASVADKLSGDLDLDNWPPAGWNGFDKTDFGAKDPGAFTSPSGKPAGFVDNPVHYATKLIGTAGDDVINGTLGNDFFNGLGGDDVLNGGPGDDAFHFMAGFGQDVVIGFTAGAAGGDVIEFRGVFSNFDDVLAASRQVGPNVLIELDDQNGVALIDVALSSLNQDDFRFV
jgi:hemolysin type calcium-binding protein